MLKVVGLTEISAVAAAAGVILGLIYYVLDIRHQTMIREMDLLMRLQLHACGKEFMDAYQKILNMEFKDYDDFVKKYGPLTAEKPEQTSILMLAMFMEGIGVLLHRKLADIEGIRELFPIESGWEKLEPVLVGTRNKSGNPEAWAWFEYLYNEVKKKGRNQ